MGTRRYPWASWASWPGLPPGLGWPQRLQRGAPYWAIGFATVSAEALY